MIALLVDGKVHKIWSADLTPMQVRADFMNKQHYYMKRYPGKIYELAELVPDVFFELEKDAP